MDTANRRRRFEPRNESLRTQIDSAKRRSLGLTDRASSKRKFSPSSTDRKWTEEELRAAVGRVSGGRKISPGAYITARKELDPKLYPTCSTAKSRCPDLFT